MNQATHLTPGNSLDLGALTRPVGRYLGWWLAAVTHRSLAEAAPATAVVSVSALDKGRTLWVDQPMSREVSCLEGTLWLTIDGVQKDLILEAGESHRCDHRSRLAIHALNAARVRMA